MEPHSLLWEEYESQLFLVPPPVSEHCTVGEIRESFDQIVKFAERKSPFYVHITRSSARKKRNLINKNANHPTALGR